jgi:hypothetical protein
VLLAIGLLSTAVGCGNIRVVRAGRHGGEIALVGDRAKALELARGEMARTCGGPDRYEVVEEGEAVVGTVSSQREESTTQRGQTFFGRPAVRTSTVGTVDTHQKTEWRLHYECKVAQPATPSAAASPDKPQARSLHEVVVVF